MASIRCLLGSAVQRVGVELAECGERLNVTVVCRNLAPENLVIPADRRIKA